MRGVHNWLCLQMMMEKGSSPHARGPREQGFEMLAVPGIIPACAGSTEQWRCRHWRRQDHPRMRGVHGSGLMITTATVGSSPHARGPRAGDRHPGGLPRIIPACAGSTGQGASCSGQGQDHPRMRGVHTELVRLVSLAPGSSPHARGPLGFFRLCRISQGIIPACAGSTINKRIRIPIRWDHPRMRGVHSVT